MKRSRNGLGSHHNPDRETLLPLFNQQLFLVKTSPSPTVAPMVPGNGIICQNDAHTAWLNKVSDLIQKEETDCKDNLSWSAHFASLQKAVSCSPAITGLLPLFRDSAHSVSMVKHGMNLIQRATEHVNHGQVPVITVDQPLYAIAKKIQWTWYGESKFVVMLSGLHIEMSFLRLIGDWLAGSGWVEAITAAYVTTEGRVDGLLKGSRVTRGQWAHQVSAAALYVFQKRAYAAFKEELATENTLEIDDWCNHMQVSHPQFNYWSKVMKLQLLFLQFLRSQREANFQLYIETLGKIIPWMFAMDHIHHARWLTINVIDLLQLQSQCPEIYEEFVKGRFVTQKTSHKAGQPVDTPLSDIKIIDGAALVHTLHPKRSGVMVKTFQDHSEHILPHIARQLQCV